MLLELCLQRFGTEVSLVGVDMSADELRLARQRLPGTGIDLYEGVAQDLHFIADGTIDLIFCHWALTLMDPVISVLHEARRVLARNGTFAAIIDGDPVTAPGYVDVHSLIYEWVQRRYPEYGTIELGDARVRTKKALLELAREAFTGAHIEIEPAVLRLYASPAILHGRSRASSTLRSSCLHRIAAGCWKNLQQLSKLEGLKIKVALKCR